MARTRSPLGGSALTLLYRWGNDLAVGRIGSGPAGQPALMRQAEVMLRAGQLPEGLSSMIRPSSPPSSGQRWQRWAVTIAIRSASRVGALAGEVERGDGLVRDRHPGSTTRAWAEGHQLALTAGGPDDPAPNQGVIALGRGSDEFVCPTVPAASSISYRNAPGARPMLSATEPRNKSRPWVTVLAARPRSLRASSRESMPSRRTLPMVGSWKRAASRAIVALLAPVGEGDVVKLRSCPPPGRRPRVGRLGDCGVVFEDARQLSMAAAWRRS